MKIALVSQRVDVLADRGERRDAVDQRLLDWLAGSGFLPVPVPNRADRVEPLWTRVAPALVVLSGGNDLVAYGGDAPERDETERALVARAARERLPVLGVCRGAQLLLEVYGHRLEHVPGHIGTRHDLQLEGVERSVNSFHAWGCREIAPPLRVLACAADGVIEAFCHSTAPMLGIMWHPERESPFHEHDRALLERHLSQERPR